MIRYNFAYSPSNEDAPNGFSPNTSWFPVSQPIIDAGEGKDWYVFNMGGILFYTSQLKDYSHLLPYVVLFGSSSNNAAEAAETLEELEPVLINAAESEGLDAVGAAAGQRVDAAIIAQIESLDAETVLVALE